ncbi:MAG: hypothetical protein R3A13_02215 [Bdellovibrionota bacterium]
MTEIRSVLNIDTLLPDQKQLAKHYAELSGFGGLVSAVILGREDWDVRPLILKSGKLYLLRTVPSEAVADQRQQIDLRNLYPRLRQMGLVSKDLLTGEAAGRYWLVRPFFKDSLDSVERVIIDEYKTKGVPALIAEIKKLHANAFIHGHICPSNVVVNEAGFHLVDHGFFLHRGKYGFDSFEAPELIYGVTQAADIYGLGKVLEKVFNAEELVAHRAFLIAMSSKNAELRPSLEEIEAHFFGSSTPKVATQYNSGAGRLINLRESSSEAVIQSGKIITTSATDSATPKKLTGVHLWAVLIIMSAVLIYLRVDFFDNHSSDLELVESEVQTASSESVSYQDLWLAGSKADREVVVQAAVVENNLGAQRAILLAAAKHKSPENVREELILRAFDQRWATELNSEDRQAVFILATGFYLAANQKKIPQLNALHPGVILSVISSAPLEKNSEQIAAIEVKKLGSLPKPIGLSFDVLAKEGFKTFKSIIPRAFAQLVVGEISKTSVSAFLSKSEEVTSTRIARLLLLMPHISDDSARIIREEIKFPLKIAWQIIRSGF